MAENICLPDTGHQPDNARLVVKECTRALALLGLGTRDTNFETASSEEQQVRRDADLVGKRSSTLQDAVTLLLARAWGYMHLQHFHAALNDISTASR